MSYRLKQVEKNERIWGKMKEQIPAKLKVKGNLIQNMRSEIIGIFTSDEKCQRMVDLWNSDVDGKWEYFKRKSPDPKDHDFEHSCLHCGYQMLSQWSGVKCANEN